MTHIYLPILLLGIHPEGAIGERAARTRMVTAASNVMVKDCPSLGEGMSVQLGQILRFCLWAHASHPWLLTRDNLLELEDSFPTRADHRLLQWSSVYQIFHIYSFIYMLILTNPLHSFIYYSVTAYLKA